MTIKEKKEILTRLIINLAENSQEFYQSGKSEIKLFPLPISIQNLKNQTKFSLEEIKETLKEIVKESRGAIKQLDFKKLYNPVNPVADLISVRIILGRLKTYLIKDEKRFPYRLPAGTKWENITLKFLNDENVCIFVGKKYKHYTNYEGLGLMGRGKNPKPSVLWTFLKALAMVNGEIAPKDQIADKKYKKQKELLVKKLRYYFGIDYDPFYPYEPYPPYKHERSYKIRMLLIPAPKPAEIKENGPEEDDPRGITEYLKEQMPQIYDGGL